MTFRRGAAVTVAESFGQHPTSHLGPTTGNGFTDRWVDDLALLRRAGIRDLRLTFDWSRLQPTPGRADDGWVEFYDRVIEGARASELDTWAVLHESGIPRWFDDEGGLADAPATTRRWPYWVEFVAERFGDRIDGWLPFVDVPADLPERAWADTWGILGGGPAPVAVALPAAAVERFRTAVEQSDLVGVVLDSVPDVDELPERYLEQLHRAAEAAHRPDILVSGFPAPATGDDVDHHVMEALVHAADSAVADGLRLRTVVVTPAIARADHHGGLFDQARALRPAAEPFLPEAI